ncbi:MAG: hypothetical protein M1830_009365 [Pleopsidium flavum]|nr:MAG: hypothetical protein M1830_009365 [Pleopsidium flavum]
MQSILAYRRFGRHVNDQYERDKDKAGGNLRHQVDQISTTSSTSSSATAASTPGANGNTVTGDPEKAEKPYAADSEQLVTDGTALNPTAQSAAPSVERLGTLNRADTIKTQHSIGTNLGTALTGINVRDRTTREGGGKGRVFVVGYEGECDSMNPHNWSFTTRWAATFNIACIGAVVGFASSIDSAALVQAAADFGVSEVTESLATGLFLIGFGSGALFAGPISETIGRNPVYIATLSLYMIFIMASALAPNIGAQLAFRFLAGFFGSTPLTCAGGSISDLWSPMERVYAFPVFATAAFMGPIFGPIVGGFIGQSSRVSWRWTEWVTLIISGIVLILVVLFQPESYAPILLKWKANHLRNLTGDNRYKAEVEIREETFSRRLRHALYRPFMLTAREPIIMLVALYLTVIYVILFTFLNGYTFIFTDVYGFSQGLTGLSFIGIGIGLCCVSPLVLLVFVWAKRDLKKIQEDGGTRLPPEFRLWYAMFGAPAVSISVFMLGWTAYPSISCWVPLAASVLFGFGILCVFISSYQYIIDAYETFSASALASVTLIRYVAAGGMVEVSIPMYKKLGVHWTLTILGCISALLVPVPYAFYRLGPKIRAKSKYAVA